MKEKLTQQNIIDEEEAVKRTAALIKKLPDGTLNKLKRLITAEQVERMSKEADKLG